MPKFVACEDQFVAKGLCRGEALARGQRGNLYPPGWSVGSNGIISIPDTDQIVSRVADKAKDTVEKALSNRVIPTLPKKGRRP
jgi:hypothetical protein